MHTIALMAERQVALVPTLLQLANFESYAAAGEARYPTYAKHIRHLARRQQVVFAARPTRPACRSTPGPTRAATCRTD